MSFQEYKNKLRNKLQNALEEYPFNQPFSNKVPLNRSTLEKDDIFALLECFVEDQLTMGPKVLEFEQVFARRLGRKHALMVNSGTSANFLIIQALSNPLWAESKRLKAGDEVLVPAVTWSTNVTPLMSMGVVPVFVDAERATLNISVDSLKASITKKTKALFIAHILGNAFDVGAVRKIAEENHLLFIEDTCESLGTLYKGKPVGSFSLASSFSFYFSHHITTIEGGMVTTDDDELAEIMRALRAHGWARHLNSYEAEAKKYPEIDPRFLFLNIGQNLRSTDINAALGLTQLAKLDKFNQRRVEIATQMKRELEVLKGRFFNFVEPTAGAEHTWFGFPVLLTERWAGEREGFIAHLESKGIETRPVVAGNLARQPFVKHFPTKTYSELKNADFIMKAGVYWACHPKMEDQEITYICDSVKGYFRDKV